MALHVFAATSGNFWEAPRAAIAVKKNVPLEWMELSQLSLYMALGGPTVHMALLRMRTSTQRHLRRP